MHYDGAVEGICKATEESPYGLPWGFRQVQGPSAWRDVGGTDPLERMAVANARAESLASLYQNMRRSPNTYRGRKKKQQEMARMMDQLLVAEQLGG